MALWRAVENGKSPVRWSNAHHFIHPHAGIVRAAMRDGSGHAVGDNG